VSVHIIESKFINNFAINGGCVAIMNTSDVMIMSSEFINGKATNIGGAIMIDSVTNIMISDSSFTSNSAATFGGAVSINHITGLAVISQSIFQFNVAKYGSAIVLSRCKDVRFHMNALTTNEAMSVGTIYWIHKSGMAEPMGLFNNSYVGNIGTDVATDVIGLVPLYPKLVMNDYINPYPLSENISIIDYYGQRTSVRDLKVFIEAHATNATCFNYKSSLKGVTTAFATNGIALFPIFGASCIPGGNISL
jgi:predicted outer membrane repeat protein